MKCKKCGYEIQDDDVFCPNCGMKIDKDEEMEKSEIPPNDEAVKEVSVEEEVKDEKIDNTKRSHHNSKKKLFIILSTIVAIIIIGVITFFVLNQPKDIEIEASELSELMNNGEAKKYGGDHLFVHGYLLRVDDENNRYALKGNKDDLENILIFTYDKGLDDEIGDNSELIVTGELGEYKDVDMTLLLGEEIQVKKKEERFIDAGDTTSLLKNKNEYLNKKVTVTGKMVITNAHGVYITDRKISDSVWLYGISVQEALKYEKEYGSWCTVSGTFFKDDQGLETIQFEAFIQNEALEALNEEEISNSQYSVDDVLNNPEKFLDKKIAIYGKLPQSITYDHSGNPNPAIFNETTDNFIVLKGEKITIGGCDAIVKGTLTSNGIDLILDVEDFYRI
ncbi:zinc ribbon domain-containing protein [[Clostridium] innocuum]|nr:zinc ribbon domain-containing protein [[Clostridium] innocuum]